MLAPLALSAPGDILFENYFSSNGDLSSDWNTSSNSDVGVSTATYSSSPSSAYLRQGPQTMTLKSSRAIAAAVPGAEYSVWIRRGDDSFSEDPDNGEDLRVEYLNSSNTWIMLETFPGAGTPGEIFTRTYTLPSDALHNGLLLRFTATNSNVINGDYWHVDDVVVTETGTTGPAAEWRFDESAWSGSANEVIDYSGNGMYGTANGGATTDGTTPAVSGDPGTCRYGVFDGVNDYVNVGNISNTLNGTASLAFWIRTTQTGNDTGWMAPGVAGVEEAGGTDDIFWGWLDASGRIGISVGNDYTTKSTIAVNDGSWHHVVLTRNQAAGAFKIYIDGSLNTSGAIATGTIGNGYSSIGRIEDTGGSPEYFAGQLDEVRVYGSVLSDAEVATIAAETHACTAVLCPSGVAQGGLIGDYYNTTDFSGGIVGSRLDGPINFDWGSGAPGVSGVNSNQFSVQWNGYIRATETGNYQFQTVSDDGVRLTVNSQVVIESWTNHAATTDTSASVFLVAGQVYPVLLEFYENGGLAEIRLRWQTPSGSSFVPIPQGPAVLGEGLYSCTTNVVSYYGISHSGSGLTCEAEPVTITAYDAGNNPVNPPSGTAIVLATTPATGTWAGGNGYTFSGSESSVIKYLSQTTPATLNIDVSDGSASESPTIDPDIIFSDVGLKFYGDTASNPLPNQVAGVTDPNLVLRIVEASSDTGACVARLQNTSHAVDLAYECRDPTTCSSGQSLSLNGSNVQANDNGAAINYTSVNLSFDSSGFAAIPFVYSDVGLVRLHGRVDLSAQNNDPAITVSGSSSEFVVKPDSLAVITVETLGGTPNPGGQSGGSGFVAAADEFLVQVEARNANGARTPAFGRETTVEGVQVAIDELSFPIGGNIGALNNASAFFPVAATPGVYENANLSWNEVGAIRLLASLTDGDYLGSGAVSGTQSNVIGRFYPARFDLTSSAVTNSCPAGSFSYLSDPAVGLSYQIAARNSVGNTVANYDNTDLSYPATAITWHGEDNNNGVDLGTRINAATATWDDGVITLADSSASVARYIDGSLNTVPDGPFSSFVVGISVNDIDGANFQNLNLKADDNNDCIADGDCSAKLLAGILDARFGRLVVKDVYGPESAPIPMLWQTEYWNGSNFVLNSDDHCTQLPLSAVTFVGATSAVDAVNDTVTVDIGGVASIFDFGDPIGASDCLTATTIGFCDGRAGIAYGAPNAIVTYPIDIDLTGLNFLQGDWNQDGSYDDPNHPRVYIRFQHYRGNDRIIYWRERLQ